jgi:hypothetical protein
MNIGHYIKKVHVGEDFMKLYKFKNEIMKNDLVIY